MLNMLDADGLREKLITCLLHRNVLNAYKSLASRIESKSAVSIVSVAIKIQNAFALHRALRDVASLWSM